MSNTLLRIDVSPRGSASHSRRLADELMEFLVAQQGFARIIRRDLIAEPIDLIDEGFTRSMPVHTTREAAAGQPALALSERLIGELEISAALVISTPVHNYTVPAPLKAWIDQVVRAGRAFRITPDGKVGSLWDRPTFIVAASGGYFSAGTARQPDFFTPYLDAIFATIGIRDVRHLRLEGLSRGESAVAQAYASVRAEMQTVLLCKDSREER